MRNIENTSYHRVDSRTCSLASVSWRSARANDSRVSPVNAGGEGDLREPRRDAGERFDGTRGPAAARAVAPFEMEDEGEWVEPEETEVDLREAGGRPTAADMMS